MTCITPMDVQTLDPSRHHYECADGHAVTNSPAPLGSCPAYVRGEACDGDLTPFGPGSRKASQ